MRETAEYGSAVAAELAGLPHARVGIGLAIFEEQATAIAAATVSELRESVGLEADPAGVRIRSAPYLTFFPASLEAPGEPEPPRVHRFRHAVPPSASALPDWWDGRDEPLVYVTFGSVAGGLPGDRPSPPPRWRRSRGFRCARC